MREIFEFIWHICCMFVFVSCFVVIKKEQQQTQQQHVHVMSEDEAAGLRKQLIRFHCISCDRPIDVQPHPFVLFFWLFITKINPIFQTTTESSRKSGYASHPVTPTLHYLRTGPNSPISKEVQSLKFINWIYFSIDSQQYNNEFGGGVSDVYSTLRQCGGSHTMTLPFKRQIKTQ